MRKSDITYQEKYGELLLDIKHPKSKGVNFIFVEGESDIRLFRKLFADGKCKVENIPGGRDKVEQAVAQLLRFSKLVIGIRDADFIRLNDVEYNKVNIFLTDCHDIEMTMLAQSSIAKALLVEHTNLNESDLALFLQQVMISIAKVSYLKWLNDKEDLKLRFAGTGFLNLVVFATFEIDFDLYLQRILTKSNDAENIDKRDIKEKLEQLCAVEPDLWQLTNGHDMLATLAKYFKDECKAKGVSEETIVSSLRIAFTFEHFQHTDLYRQLCRWQNENQTQLFV